MAHGDFNIYHCFEKVQTCLEKSKKICFDHQLIPSDPMIYRRQNQKGKKRYRLTAVRERRTL